MLGLLAASLVTTTLVSGSVMSIAPAPAAAAAAASSVSILQVNINGAAYGGDPSALDDVIPRIDRRPDVVLLQEVCQRQLDRLNGLYPGLVQSQVIGVNSKCLGAQGEATQTHFVVLSKWVPTDSTFLSYSLGLSKGILCARIPKNDGAFTACSTKFDSGGSQTNAETRVQQSKELKSLIAQNYPGTPVVLGGDLNAEPGARELDSVYRIGRAGRLDDPNNQRGLFWEGDEVDSAHFGDRTNGVTCSATAPNPTHCRTGGKTHNVFNAPQGGRKIDYVFFKFDFFDGNSVTLDVVRRTNQEREKGKHAMLVARATPTY